MEETKQKSSLKLKWRKIKIIKIIKKQTSKNSLSQFIISHLFTTGSEKTTKKN